MEDGREGGREGEREGGREGGRRDSLFHGGCNIPEAMEGGVIVVPDHFSETTVGQQCLCQAACTIVTHPITTAHTEQRRERGRGERGEGGGGRGNEKGVCVVKTNGTFYKQCTELTPDVQLGERAISGQRFQDGSSLLTEVGVSQTEGAQVTVTG